MSRIARVVVPGIPHHVTQRGNRRQNVFFGDEDYRRYLELLAMNALDAGVALWAWCLMPNHVHLMMVPSGPDSLRAALAETHRRYSREVNERQGWRGYLWQGRFASCPLDSRHAAATARYIELNPVRAGLVAEPSAWPWSSARAHLTGQPDGLTTLGALDAEVGDWARFLGAGIGEEELKQVRRGERTGRPLGDSAFVQTLESQLGRLLTPRKRGPKPRPKVPAEATDAANS